MGPAVVLEDLADVTLDVGSQRAGAVVILIVALAGVDVDEVVLDGSLQTAWHVVIDGGEPLGHADGLVLAEQWTVFALHLRITEIDTGNVEAFCRLVVAENAVKAVIAQGADVTVAGFVVVGLLGEDFFAGLRCIVVLCHS